MKNNEYWDIFPVGIEEFISSNEYLGETKIWPAIKTILCQLFNTSPYAKNFSKYKEFVFDAGIGSGKSFITSAIMTYFVYRLLCFKDPQKIYNLSPGSLIAVMNMSKSAVQAKKVVFSEIKSRIDNSPWFKNFAMPDPNIQSELRFPKNVVILPGNSKETFPLGYNLIAANMDEASFYTETETHDVAEEIFNALSRRLTSRFGNCGLLCITSSPRYTDDFTEKKMEEAKINPKVFARRLSTWDSNPEDQFDIQNNNSFESTNPSTKEKVLIPNKYSMDFQRNPNKAWRDFGALPSFVLEPYMADEIQKLETIMLRHKSSFVQTAYYVHIDLGLKRDACGFALGHFQDDKVYIDSIKRIVCRQKSFELERRGIHFDEICGDGEINFEEVRNLIKTFQRSGYQIKVVSYDSWQSIDSRQILETEGFETKLLSVDRDTIAYDTLKSLINTDRLECVNHPFALGEIKRLELVKGKKIDHPPNGTKDCADAIAGVCRSILEDFDIETEESYIVTDSESRVKISDDL